jgi:hypothetical protein
VPIIPRPTNIRNKPITIVERLTTKFVMDPSGCWLWTKTTRPQGYGIFSMQGKGYPAHRVIWELVRGPIDSGLFLDHLCRTPPCVNPRHLEPVLPRENILRGKSYALKHLRKKQDFRRRTHCKQGHELTPENTYIYDAGAVRPYHYCRICKAEFTKISQDKKWAVIRADKARISQLEAEDTK